jgi:hypothetical protein
VVGREKEREREREREGEGIFIFEGEKRRFEGEEGLWPGTRFKYGQL